MATRPSAVPARIAFLHVVYQFRYFALAAGAWHLLGPNGAATARDDANAIVPGVGALVQDSLLAHVRALVDFFTKTSNLRVTDILVEDFDLGPLTGSLATRVREYKEPIEVHLLHITAWRDVPYRQSQSMTPDGLPRQRIDWDHKIPVIVSDVKDALATVANTRSAPWAVPFTLLSDSVAALSADVFTPWPAALTEASDVAAYLSANGL